MSISYEWTIELVDRYGDVLESDFEDTLEDAKRKRDNLMPCRFGATVRIALVRDEFSNKTESLMTRYWAYLNDDDKFIHTHFTNSHGDLIELHIPKRFIAATEKA